jgi:hypothetical protein
MAIKKQEFYEGAALHMLARSGAIKNIFYDPPFFVFNTRTWVLLKYCTRGRTPWGFTFGVDEQTLLQRKAVESTVVIGLICGADGIAAFGYDDFVEIAPPGAAAIHIACYRKHGEHFEVNGPNGKLRGKVAPSSWLKILGT